MPKDFVEEPFSLSLISGIGKIYASEEYVTIFPRKLFVSKCRKISYRNLLVFHYFRVSNKFMVQRVMSRFSVEIFCLTVPKNFVEEPFCAVFQLLVAKKFMDKKGGGGSSVKIFSGKFFV